MPLWWAILLILILEPTRSCLICYQRLVQRPQIASPSSLLAAPLVVDQLVALPLSKYKARSRGQGHGEVHFMKMDDDEDYFDPISYSGEDDAFDDKNGESDQEGDPKREDDTEEGLQKLMLDSIRWYKSTLSPMMQPNCRFLPTCSSYGLASIKKFGPVKGGVLTAWRILRCTPFGGSGYDAPQWPPPGYRAGSNTKPWF